jgi:hypothetical protein
MPKSVVRGNHTTIIEAALSVCKMLEKIGVEISPGIIIARVTSKKKSIKLKKLNNETFEMIIVVKSSKQIFKLYSKDHKAIIEVVNGLTKEG